jgi:hypothetical protein
MDRSVADNLIIHEAGMAKSMKIAFIQNSFAGGGAEKTALILAQALRTPIDNQ